MRIAIVGAGALGLYYGALLQRGGHDVHFLLRSDYEAIKKNGLSVHSINGDFYLPKVSVYNDSKSIGSVDIVIVALKTFDNGFLSDLIKPLVKDDTKILTLQNGLGNEEYLAGLFGVERILGGVAFLCSNKGEPGHVHHLAAGRVTLGSFDSRSEAFCRTLSDEFKKSGIDCRTTDDLKKTRWEKLVWNIPFNGLCALMQQPVNHVLRCSDSRKLVKELMLEVITAANSQGLLTAIQLEYADSMIKFTDDMGEYKPSMQIDRENNRQMELEAIFSFPIRSAIEKSAPMKNVEMLAALLKLVEYTK